MEFLFIRNKLLQTWLQDPTNELTVERAQSIVVLPQSGERGVVRVEGGRRGGRQKCPSHKLVCLQVYSAIIPQQGWAVWGAPVS